MEGRCLAIGAAVTLFALTACADSGYHASPARLGPGGHTLTSLVLACGVGGRLASISRKMVVRVSPWSPVARGSWMEGCLADLFREDLGVRAS